MEGICTTPANKEGKRRGNDFHWHGKNAFVANCYNVNQYNFSYLKTDLLDSAIFSSVFIELK